jgi:membrane protein YqaA with SNARE-associated domain
MTEGGEESSTSGGAGSGAPDGADGATGKARDNVVRRLYDWVLHWADTPYGVPALFIISFAESSFFPLPPDPLLLALALGASKKSFRFAAVCTLASVLGGVLGYAIGAFAWDLTREWFFAYVPGVSPEAFEGVQAFYDRHGFAAVFLAGLTPIPYKVFTLASGVFGISLGIFVPASILSRGLRFFLIAGLVWKFGPPIERFIDRHFDRLVIFFSALFVLGFLAIEFLL